MKKRVLGLAAAALLFGTAAQASGDSFKASQAYQYMKVDEANAVVWTHKSRAYWVTFENACSAMYSADASRRTRVSGDVFDRVGHEGAGSMTFGYTRCDIDRVARLSVSEIKNLKSNRQIADHSLAPIEVANSR